MERYPENTNISLDDFNACGWREALEEARREDYSSMWKQLSSRARKATEEGNLEAGNLTLRATLLFGVAPPLSTKNSLRTQCRF